VCRRCFSKLYCSFLTQHSICNNSVLREETSYADFVSRVSCWLVFDLALGSSLPHGKKVTDDRDWAVERGVCSSIRDSTLGRHGISGLANNAKDNLARCSRAVTCV
jgi:uncharacterized membrane protein